MTKQTETDKKPRAPKREGAQIAADLEARLAKIKLKNKLEGTPGLRDLKSVQVSLLLMRGKAKGSTHEAEVEAIVAAVDALVKKLEA